MRFVLALLVVLSMSLAGCHGHAPLVVDAADALRSAWSGDTDNGVQCRLVQPTGPIAVDEEAPVRVEYDLSGPARFDAVEVELGDGLARVGGLLRETDPDNDTSVAMTLQPFDTGDYGIHAYVVWDDAHGGQAERCGTFTLTLAAEPATAS